MKESPHFNCGMESRFGFFSDYLTTIRSNIIVIELEGDQNTRTRIVGTQLSTNSNSDSALYFHNHLLSE